MATAKQLPPLLSLPGELRNHIYEYVAHSTKTVVLLDPEKRVTLPHPLSLVSGQFRREFQPLYEHVSLTYATELIICNTNLNFWSVIHGLHNVPAPAPKVKRSTTIILSLTNNLQVANLQAFVKQVSNPATVPESAVAIKYQVVFDPETFDLVTWRCSFARVAKMYRFHHCDAEQRAWEGVYWAFAEAAEKVDGVCVKEFASGYWKRKGGGLCFI